MDSLSRNTGVKAGAIFVVIAKNKLYLLLITPEKVPILKTVEIDSDTLKKKCEDFQLLITNPKLDCRQAGYDLYQLLIEPIENALDLAGIEIIMWSLDGYLRYIPLAALWNDKKKQYLVEKYMIDEFTTRSLPRLEIGTESQNQILGFGTTEGFQESDIQFDPLPGVRLELEGIIATSQSTSPQESNKTKLTKIKPNISKKIAGKIFINREFDLSFTEKVQQNNYNIVHIASHFCLKTDDPDESFLLLGNKLTYKISAFQKADNIFMNKDLVVLSACSTALGRDKKEDSAWPDLKSGREIESLAMTLEKLGARAIMGTLWPVADDSTAQLMQTFYQNWEMSDEGATKARALQQAQISLLRGKSSILNGKLRSEPPKPYRGVLQTSSESIKRIPFKPPTNAPAAHPFYWASFILIGNWQ